MARLLRMGYTDTFYHVLSHSNPRRDIFYDDKNYREFLDVLGYMAERFTLEVRTYVLTRNQYHLLVRTPTRQIFPGPFSGWEASNRYG